MDLHKPMSPISERLCQENELDINKVKARAANIEQELIAHAREPYTSDHLVIAAVGMLVNQRDRMKKETL